MKRVIRILILALLLLNLCVCQTYGQSKSLQNESSDSSNEATIHLNTKLVTFPVTVTDSKGKCVKGLEKDNFEVYDNKIKQTIDFFSVEDSPFSAVLVFDLSGSMTNYINRAIASLQEFIKSSNEKDEYCLITFNDAPQIVSGFTQNADALANSVALPVTEGRTALYDAVYLGLEKVHQAHRAKKVLLIISDGQDNNSRYSLTEIKRQAQESDALVYAIGIIDPHSNDTLDKQGGWILQELAQMTGGRAFFPDNSIELQKAIIEIMLELRVQYSIGFSPTTNNDGKWHKLNLRLNIPKNQAHLSVRGRQGYFAK